MEEFRHSKAYSKGSAGIPVRGVVATLMQIQPEYTGPRLFGAPVGDFSLFQTMLATVALGALSFFLATFLGIVGMVVASAVQHRMLDFSIAYRWIGLPFGILMMVVSGLYLGSMLVRRITRQGRG